MEFGWRLDRSSDGSVAGKHPFGYRDAASFQTRLSRAELTHTRARVANKLFDPALAV